jgi:hypothetical protein
MAGQPDVRQQLLTALPLIDGDPQWQHRSNDIVQGERLLSR